MQFWLIVRHDVGSLEPLATEFTDGRRALNIFSFEEEAWLFLRLGTHSGWRVRATGLGELVSVLYGPCREVELVALDPLPQREAEAVNSLPCVDRERFVDFLFCEGGQVIRPAGLFVPIQAVATLSLTREARRCPAPAASKDPRGAAPEIVSGVAYSRAYTAGKTGRV